MSGSTKSRPPGPEPDRVLSRPQRPLKPSQAPPQAPPQALPGDDSTATSGSAPLPSSSLSTGSGIRGSGASATWWGSPLRAARPPDRLSGLAQSLVGEAVLQHVAGRRVLDLGHGSPEIAHWVRPLCASLDTVDLHSCTDATGEIRLPHADARFDVVYCVRTIAHLGHDEASSDLGVRSLLTEAARVTVPGGVLLVEINNPRSLRGFFYGIRRPITVVSTGSVVLADDKHRVIRHDTLARLQRIAPGTLETVAVYGIRVLVPIARAHRIPILGRLLAAGEWWARDSLLRGFGAHLLVALRKDEDAGKTLVEKTPTPPH